MPDVKYRLQLAVWHDSIAPRDAAVINPCFVDHGATSDPQNLVDSLASAAAGMVSTPTAHQIRVRAYDLEGTKPVHPAAEKILHPNQAAEAVYPRELAVALSFYGGQNVPRRRGRLYIPYFWFGTHAPTLRPSTTHRTVVANWVPILASLGGVDVDWVVWSVTSNMWHKVSNYWVDDEWDIVRSRGLRPTARTTGTTGG